MSVHYKFKTSLEYDTLTFDGLHISVADLKAAIFQQKRIGKTSDFDLQITNAQTKEVYSDNSTLVPKNTSLLVARVPLAQKPKKNWDGPGSQAPILSGARLSDGASAVKGSVDLSRMEGSEEDKIIAMMSQSTQDYDPSNYQNFRGSNQRGELPPNYRCHKCHETGHWIKDCPLGVNTETVELKRSTGIPRSFMVPVEGPSAPGAMITPNGAYAVPAVDHEAYKASDSGVEQPSVPSEPVRKDIPEDLLCSLCKDLLTDAVMIPCCGNSFCDECIRGALLESEDHECPDCRDKDISPSTLIPNRFLRNSVTTFRNQTGYIPKPRPQPVPKELPPPEEAPPPAVECAEPPESSNDNQERQEEPKEPAPVRRKSREEAYEDSDGSYDDNITVTVPPVQTSSLRHHQPYNSNGSKPPSMHHPSYLPSHHKLQQADDFGRPPTQNIPYGMNSKTMNLKPPGLETSPSTNVSVQDDRISSVSSVMNERKTLLQQPRGLVPIRRMPQQRPEYMAPNQPPHYTNPGVPPTHPAPYNAYGQVPPMNAPPYGAPPGTYPPAYRPLPPGAVSQMPPHQPAPGLIEDPLEAFERMIRQKEELARMREKRSRTRSRSRSRSRSISRSRSRSRFTRSPSRGRIRSRNSLSRSRSRPTSVRSPLRRPPPEKFRRSSFSRSPPPRRPVRPPSIRRSRERSKSFSPSRSRSRSIPPVRDGPPRRRTPPRYRSPLRGPPRGSPRPRFNNIPPHKRGAGDSRSLRSPPPHTQGPPPLDPHHRFGAPPSSVPTNLVQIPIAAGGPGARFGPPFDDAPPGTQPPPPGEQSPIGRRDGSTEPNMDKDRPGSPFRGRNFREHRPPLRENRDGPPMFPDIRDNPPGIRDEFRDVPPPGIRDTNFARVDRPPAFRDGPPGFQDAHEFRENQAMPPQDFRENQVGHFRDAPPGGYRDLHAPFRDGPPAGFRENIPPQGPYRDRLPPPGCRDGPPPSGFRDGPPPSGFRDGPPPSGFRDGPPPSGFRDGPPPPGFRDGPPPSGFRDGPPPFRDGPPPFRDGPPPFRDGPPTFRDGPERFRDNNFRDGPHRDRQGHGRDAPHSRDTHPHNRDNYHHNRDGPHGRDHFHRDGHPRSHHDRGPRDHPRHDFNKSDRHRDRENRDFRDSDKRDKDYERTREDRFKEYDKNEKDKEHSTYYSPDRKRRSVTPKRESRDDRLRHRIGDSRGKTKDSPDDRRDQKHQDKLKTEDDKAKDKERKLKDKKKKKKEKDVEKRKKKEKKEKKEKQEVQKEDEEPTDNIDVNDSGLEPVEISQNESKVEESESVVYNDIEEDDIDKSMKEDYMKGDVTPNNDEEDEKETSFDGIELQANDLDLKPESIEMTKDKNKNEVLAPFPELSKWEIDDDQISGNERKEPGEIDSPDKSKVTSEVLKRAENAIFAKAINAIRPIEIKRISSDRAKLYSGEIEEGQIIEKEGKGVDNIQITVPTNTDQRSVEINEARKIEEKTPPKLSVKERLGSKVEEPHRRPRELHSTVERIRSRSRTPQGRRLDKDPQRRVMIESSRERNRRYVTKVTGTERNVSGEYRIPSRHEHVYEEHSHHRNREIHKSWSPQERLREERKRERNISIGNSPDRKVRRKEKKQHRKEKEEKQDRRAENDTIRSAKAVADDSVSKEKDKPSENERKKSVLDESNFEPDYDETVVESDNDGKETVLQKDAHPTTTEEDDQNTIKLDLTNVRMRIKSESSSSSEDSTSSSTSSGSKKRKRKKRKNKKKKSKHYSESGSDSDSSSDEPKKKKKKHKHKKKSSKKKKKVKHKSR